MFLCLLFSYPTGFSFLLAFFFFGGGGGALKVCGEESSSLNI